MPVPVKQEPFESQSTPAGGAAMAQFVALSSRPRQCGTGHLNRMVMP
jgi:hypothetical protein